MNKPLDSLEISVYRKRTHFVLVIQLMVFVVSLLLRIQTIYVSLAFAWLMLSIIVVIGTIKNNII